MTALFRCTIGLALASILLLSAAQAANYTLSGTTVNKNNGQTEEDDGFVDCSPTTGDGTGGVCLPFPLAGESIFVRDRQGGRDVAFQVCVDNNQDGICGGPESAASPCPDTIFFSHSDSGAFANPMVVPQTSLYCFPSNPAVAWNGYIVFVCAGAHTVGGQSHHHSASVGKAVLSTSTIWSGASYGFTGPTAFCGGPPVLPGKPYTLNHIDTQPDPKYTIRANYWDGYVCTGEFSAFCGNTAPFTCLFPTNCIGDPGRWIAQPLPATTATSPPEPVIASCERNKVFNGALMSNDMPLSGVGGLCYVSPGYQPDSTGNCLFTGRSTGWAPNYNGGACQVAGEKLDRISVASPADWYKIELVDSDSYYSPPIVVPHVPSLDGFRCDVPGPAKATYIEGKALYRSRTGLAMAVAASPLNLGNPPLYNPLTSPLMGTYRITQVSYLPYGMLPCDSEGSWGISS